MALQKRSKMPVSLVNALRTHQPLDFIRAVISFHVTKDACPYHRTLRNAVVVGWRLKAPPRWRLSQLVSSAPGAQFYRNLPLPNRGRVWDNIDISNPNKKE